MKNKMISLILVAGFVLLAGAVLFAWRGRLQPTKETIPAISPESALKEKVSLGNSKDEEKQAAAVDTEVAELVEAAQPVVAAENIQPPETPHSSSKDQTANPDFEAIQLNEPVQLVDKRRGDLQRILESGKIYRTISGTPRDSHIMNPKVQASKRTVETTAVSSNRPDTSKEYPAMKLTPPPQEHRQANSLGALPLSE